MTVAGIVLRKELLDHLRDRRSLLTALFYPLFGPLLFAAMLHLLGSLGAETASYELPRPLLVSTEAVAGSVERYTIGDLFLLLVPPFLLFTLFMGGVYMTLDTTAGERERGAMESLFTHPVGRGQVMLGKYVAACLFTLAALLLQLAGFHIAFRSVSPALFSQADPFGWTVIARLALVILPLLSLAVAVQFVVAAITRSQKEAQTLLGFLPLIPAIPGLLLAFQPAAGGWTLFTPLLTQAAGMAFVVRDLPLPLEALLLGALATLAATALMLRLAARLFDREQMIFPG